MLKRLPPKVVLPHRDVLVSLVEDDHDDKEVRERAGDVLDRLDQAEPDAIDPDAAAATVVAEPATSSGTEAVGKFKQTPAEEDIQSCDACVTGTPIMEPKKEEDNTIKLSIAPSQQEMTR